MLLRGGRGWRGPPSGVAQAPRRIRRGRSHRGSMRGPAPASRPRVRTAGAAGRLPDGHDQPRVHVAELRAVGEGLQRGRPVTVPADDERRGCRSRQSRMLGFPRQPRSATSGDSCSTTTSDCPRRAASSNPRYRCSDLRQGLTGSPMTPSTPASRAPSSSTAPPSRNPAPARSGTGRRPRPRRDASAAAAGRRARPPPAGAPPGTGGTGASIRASPRHTASARRSAGTGSR
jgi:hypothetical protein